MNEVLGYDAATHTQITDPAELQRIQQEDVWEPEYDSPQAISVNGQVNVFPESQDSQLVQALSRQVAEAHMQLHHKDGTIAQLLVTIAHLARLLEWSVGYCGIVGSEAKLISIGTSVGQMFFRVEDNWFQAINQNLDLPFSGQALPTQTFDNLSVIERLQNLNSPSREQGIPPQQLVPILQLLIASQNPRVEVSPLDSLQTIQARAFHLSGDLVYQAAAKLESAIYPKPQ